jgi:outer membrane protein assembly factor BamB
MMKPLTFIGVTAFLLAVGSTSLARAAATKTDNSATTTQAKNSKGRAKSWTPSRVRLSYTQHPKDSRRTITYTLVSPPKHGKVTMPAKHKKYYYQSGGNGSYTSNKDYVGPDSFTWKLNDGSGNSNVATFNVQVQATPPLPQLSPTIKTLTGQAVDININYTGGGGHSYAIKHSQPKHGSVSIKGKTFQYKSKAGYCGTDSFTWHMTYGKTGATANTATRIITCGIVVKKSGITDWPQWRADQWRSGFTSMKLPAKLHLQWQRNIPKTSSPFASTSPKIYPDIDYCRPVQLGKTLFVPVTASDRLSAYDTETGKLRWSFYASGAIRRPPAALKLAGGKAAVIFGSDDGWVYSLAATTGKLLWKFRAAPNNRQAMGFRRLSSVWPIWASPVISNGKVYLVAGYIPSFGLYAYCLDANTGRVQWVNDGRITDMWNTSTLGPLAISHDGKSIYGSVEGASRPWIVASATGEFLGHLGIGFEFPGSGKQKAKETMRKGTRGWFVDGRSTYHNISEPMSITVGAQEITAEQVGKLGVTGTVASLLAGDGKLFVTTAQGGIYCFAGRSVNKPTIHTDKITPLPAANDKWSAAAKAMLSRQDLKQGLALVLGIDRGRLVEELARQSTLMIVAVDPDHKKLQALRARADAAGLSGARISTLEGDPLDFGFAPYQAALITSEVLKSADLTGKPKTLENLFRWTRPLGGEIWLPTSAGDHAKLAALHSKSKKAPLSEISRAGNFTRILRQGLTDQALIIKPPFGLIAFGSERILQPGNPLTKTWRWRDVYSWLPLKKAGPGRVPKPLNAKKGYPTPASVSTASSVFTSLKNPLFGRTEKFPGLPSSGNDGSCSAIYDRYGDFGLTHGKISSVFDTSSRYWGRMFFPEAGGCPGRLAIWSGILINTSTPVPGSTCGCTAAMQFTTFAVAPMEFEENWVHYQNVRTSQPVEDLPIKQVGVNFAAPGDRLLPEDGTLWTHHPYSGRYGRCSYNFGAMVEALPLLPVSYSGPVKSVYHHSATMQRNPEPYRGWVAASQVKNMTAISVPLAQPAVALKTGNAPKIDGKLSEDCWSRSKRLLFAANKVVIDRDRKTGLPKPNEHCYAMFSYDASNLYVAAGVQAEFGPANSYRADTRRSMTVTLNSRERITADLSMTGTTSLHRGRTKTSNKSTVIPASAWTYASGATGGDSYTAEMAIPWKEIIKAGLWKEQLVINISIAGSSLVARYTPLYLDKARGLAIVKRPYTVRLYFAEMENQQPGQRLFDVSLQGKIVLPGLDVVAKAGGPRRQLVQEFKNVLIASELQIGFKAKAGEPLISGVELLGTYQQKDLPANAAPQAVIQSSVSSGPAPLTVTLDARSSSDSDGQILQCAWDTSDGRLASGSVLKHVFAEAGNYLVRLTVRDNRGGLSSRTLAIKVTPGKPAAFVCQIRSKDKGGDYPTLSAWEAAMRSNLLKGAKLFKVTGRGNYRPADDGKGVTFTGGGSGKLRHINGSDLAYISDCRGTIKPGTVKCASGNSFKIADSGHPLFTVVAYCHNDWPGGLTDSIKAGTSGKTWITDQLHCPVIRGGKEKTRITINGNLDLTALANLRLKGISFNPAKELKLGPNASAAHISAGTVQVKEGSSLTYCRANTFTATNSSGKQNLSPSTRSINIRDGNRKRKPFHQPVDSKITFYNCTGKSFDPGNQSEVRFIKCIIAPKGKGYIDQRYSEQPLIVR